MGALILVLAGAALAWLASIVLRVEDGRLILEHALAGSAGALLAGVFGGNASLVGGVSGMALLWAVAGALVAIGIYSLLRRQLAR